MNTKNIQIFSNSLGNEELEAISTVFNSKWLFFGKETERFENDFAKKLNSNNILFTNGCTNSIHMCLQALNIGEGDEVIMPSNSFMSCASSVKLLNATPIFCDIDKETNNICIESCKSKLNNNTKAIIILHYGGYPCDFDELKKITGNIPIIEDSANSTYSLYKGKACGTLGTFGCFSFDAMKMICCGEGGAISVNDLQYVNKLKSLRFLGLPPNSSGQKLSQNHKRWWITELDVPAIKHVSCDIQAAIMNVQLKKLDGFITRRNEITELYNNLLKNINQITLQPKNSHDYISNHYFYWIKVDIKYRDELINYLKDNNVYCTVKYWPLHLTKIFADNNSLPNIETNIEELINLPIHQNLTDEDVNYIINIIERFFKK